MTEVSGNPADDGYEGVTHAGLAIVAADTGRVLLAQRAMDETDDLLVQETWEFPGGSLSEGEDPEAAAMREFAEEIGLAIPEGKGEVVNGWRSDNYQGFVYVIPEEHPFDTWEPTAEVQALAWLSKDELNNFAGTLRPEIRETMDWSLVWGAVSGNQDNEEQVMDDETQMTEDDTDFSAVFAQPIPIHGVMAPEGTPTGDRRMFAEGSITARPYRLPFRWAETDQQDGHKGAFAIGSVDRLMRKDGVIHYQGLLMPSENTERFVNLLEFFGGRYGVSVDGVKGSLDEEKSKANDMMWFDAVQAAGLTACDIPAFQEAYVALGEHPDFPQDDAEIESLAASGDLVSFARGPGWVTNPKETNRLHDYWTKAGEPGYAKIRWGTPGDFTRAKALIGEKIAKNSPNKMKYLNQIIAQWHHDALGYWPGDLGKPGNAPDTAENRKRAAVHAAEEHGIVASEDSLEWEAVLTSSINASVAGPPAAYFERQDDSGALVISDPDENGYRHTYGYAAEWGVCHVGFKGQCVEAPSDASGEYRDFHLGRTRLADGGHLNTGVVTYKVDHRSAQTILSESAEQQHFDNIAHAWAAVRLGEDERGIWFSGVVLPGIATDDLTLIQATGQVSGEWRSGAMRALQAVNVPGFPVIRSSAVVDEEGNVLALSAAAFTTNLELNAAEASPCAEVSGNADDPVGDLALDIMSRIEAKAKISLMASVEAATRIAAAKKNWEN